MRRHISGEFRYYVVFQRGAERFLKRREENPRQEYYNRLAALVFIAFSFEAFLNHVGAKKYGDAWVERQSPVKKATRIARDLGIPVDFARRPFQTLKTCLQRRNEFAHAKPFLFDEIVDVPEGQSLNDYLFPDDPRDTFTEPAFVTLAAADLSEAIRIILEAANLEGENPFSLGTSTSAPVREQQE